jgi:hypothetical protein
MGSDEAARAYLPVFWRAIGRSDSDLEARVLERVKYAAQAGGAAEQPAAADGGQQRRGHLGADMRPPRLSVSVRPLIGRRND